MILFIPLATVVVQFGLFDSPLALILVYPTFLVPFCTWLLIGYFKSIPYELEECALVAPGDWHAAADQAASASAIPTRRPADPCRRPAMLTRYSSRARGAQDAWQ